MALITNTLLILLLLGNSPIKAHKSTGKRNQFVIYDPKSGKQLDPMKYLPVMAGNKRKPSKPSGNLVELPQLWNPCSCGEFKCTCCLGLRLGENFNNRICAALHLQSNQIGLHLRISLNQRNVISMGFAARQAQPICVPIFLPLPVFTCLRLYDIRLLDGNVQVCLSLVLNVFMSQLFELQLDCVRFGLNGVQFFKPVHYDAAEEVDFEADDDARRDVTLAADYSGISVESATENFIRKGRVRSLDQRVSI